VKAFPDWFDENRQERAKSNKHLLLVDDSSFFRNMLAPLLATVGYKVTAVENADRALELREMGNHFDVIVSDIEMPGMDGFDLASEIRSDERWGKTPIVAISSHGTPQDFDRGRSVGFTDYVVKTDRKGLLESIQETLHLEGSAA
jgi:two-component system chemotaxis sensor kinase CheA